MLDPGEARILRQLESRLRDSDAYEAVQLATGLAARLKARGAVGESRPVLERVSRELAQRRCWAEAAQAASVLVDTFEPAPVDTATTTTSASAGPASRSKPASSAALSEADARQIAAISSLFLPDPPPGTERYPVLQPNVAMVGNSNSKGADSLTAAASAALPFLQRAVSLSRPQPEEPGNLALHAALAEANARIGAFGSAQQHWVVASKVCLFPSIPHLLLPPHHIYNRDGCRSLLARGTCIGTCGLGSSRPPFRS